MKDDAILIDFAITLRCNYRCSYCDQGSQKINYPIADDEVCDGVINFVRNSKKKVILQLVGGEPTTHPRFMDIVKAIVESGNMIQTCTNFFKPIEFWEYLLDIAKDNICQIQISYHPTMVKDKEAFFNKVKTINEKISKKTKLIVAGVLNESNYGELKILQEKLKDININLQLQHERDNSGAYVKYSDVLNEMLKNSSRIEGLDEISTKPSFGINCSAGKNFFTVSTDGSVGRCYNNSNTFYSLGNIRKKIPNIQSGIAMHE